MIYGLEDRGCRSSSAAHSEYLHLVIDGLDALDDLDGDDLYGDDLGKKLITMMMQR